MLRLKSFELDPFLVSYVLRGIIAQDLPTPLCICPQKPCPKCNFSGIQRRQLNQEILHLNSSSPDTLFNATSLTDLGDYKNWD